MGEYLDRTMHILERLKQVDEEHFTSIALSGSQEMWILGSFKSILYQMISSLHQ